MKAGAIVAVAGVTGALGRQVLPRLLERGLAVRALVRRPEQADRLKQFGVAAAIGDLLDPSSLAPLVAGADAALHLATAIPKPGLAMDWSMNDRVRREGTAHLLAAAKAAGVRRYVQQSIAMLQAGHGADWVDEAAAPWLIATTQSAWDMEQIVRTEAPEALILRGGLFYGPGTDNSRIWREAARGGGLRTPGDGRDYVSLIHVADMAEAVVRALDAPGPATVAVVDDAPATWAELFGHIAAVENGAPPGAGAALRIPSFRCRNDAAKRILAWRPFYASYRAGFAGSCAVTAG